MLESVFQPQAVDDCGDPGAFVGFGSAVVEFERQSDVLFDRERGHEVEGLEDESDPATAQGGEIVVAQLRDLLVAEVDRAGGGPVESGEDVHEC